MVAQISEGSYTSTIYSYIKEKKYNEAIEVLNLQRYAHPNSRAALSLLAFCYFQKQDFVQASDCYEQLSQLCPNHPTYRLHFALCLHRAGLNEAAMQVAASLAAETEQSENKERVVKLQAAIRYSGDDFAGASAFVHQCSSEDPDTSINVGCLLYREGKYSEACKRFQQSLSLVGFQSTLAYNVALCYYQMKQYAQALKYIADIIERGIHDHPELGVGMITEGLEVRSVGNTTTLHETALVETFNLKAAIEYNLGNLSAAREALTDMPPRSEEELDHITLHNQALMNMDIAPAAGFHKLQFLLQQPTFPRETFANLLLLYIKYEYFDLAADVMAENSALAFEYLTPELHDFIEAVIMRQSAPQDAYNRLDQMSGRCTEHLRNLTKRIQEARKAMDDEALKVAVNEYDMTIEKYIPVLMQQAKIYWDAQNYQQVERIFRKSVEFCNDHETWKLNVAHVLFMQENKYREASEFYEPIVRRHFESLMSISAIISANLCVTYIMTGENADAEKLMRKLEKEEEAAAYEETSFGPSGGGGGERKVFHLCIVNLVIGTLYCTRGNYDFGISRVIRSLEPYQKKLGTDTWYYAKRCFLSMIENMAKHMIMIKDSVLMDCLDFLEHCEVYGRNVKVFADQPLEGAQIHPGQNTVTYEARILKSLLLEIMDN
ncbi:Tetratricopeptide repeat protein 30A [Taenia crassiceps]|uniref:Tetratricopeptide repeat protein 30 n=1 Tax=Taenia crassiceps TaxID=6207 RepID=A0ABR4Q1N8_9CEST